MCLECASTEMCFPINEVSDLKLEFYPSTGMYTLFPSLSHTHTQIVVLANRFMCCCYGLRTLLTTEDRKFNCWSKRWYQRSLKFVCLLHISVSPDPAKQDFAPSNWDVVRSWLFNNAHRCHAVR